MNLYEFYVKTVTAGMVAAVFAVGLISSLTEDIGTPWRWLIFTESAIGVILLIMCVHYADRSPTVATELSTSTESQEKSHARKK